MKKSTYLNTKKPSEVLSLLTLPLAFVLWEMAVRVFVFNFAIDIGLLFVPFTAFVLGTVFTAISQFFGKTGKTVFTIVVLAVGGFFSTAFCIYFKILRAFFSWRNLIFAEAVTDFFPNLVRGIIANFYMIIVCFLPLILFLVFRKRYFSLPERFSVSHTVSSAISVVLTIAIVCCTIFIPYTHDALIYQQRDFAKSFRTYGLFVTSATEAWQMFFGVPEEEVDNPYLDPSAGIGQTNPDVDPDTGVVYDYNTLNIDFDALIEDAPNENIADMHRYFASVPATQQNKYTGMFEGKNLIFLTLEGFSYKVIDPNLTPTLYKMFNEGFKFNNYYNIMWGSTASGEYANMTGNFYTQATCHQKSADTLQYSAMGNLFRNSGYTTYAYHNHTYTYYQRHRSHPNFGYSTYKGIGNGLVLKTQKCWPKSDLEMAQATISDYINTDGPFHTYYMTVSGHANYTWTDNSMCSRHHKDIPADFPYSDGIKAYFAAHLEVELMLTELIKELEAAGKLADTVFAMAGDHYPYPLTDAQLSELYGLPEENIRSNFELYHNSFILWSASMEEPIEVDTPCTSYDIIPTLANLFGIDYESKVIIGKDILSSTEKIVIINDDGTGSSWNWITEQGQYNTATKIFTPSNKCTLTDEETEDYVRITNMKVAAMRKYSHALLDRNYYSYVFNADGTPKKTTK